MNEMNSLVGNNFSASAQRKNVGFELKKMMKFSSKKLTRTKVQ